MLLDSFVGRDEPGRVVGTEEVPRIEAGEVLKGAEELIATNYQRGVLALGRQLRYSRSVGELETHLLSRRIAGSVLP